MPWPTPRLAPVTTATEGEEGVVDIGSPCYGFDSCSPLSGKGKWQFQSFITGIAPGPAAADEQKISLALTPDEIDLLRECMKRTEDYYRGLLLLKQDWNAAQNETAIAMIKVRLNMIDKLQEKTLYDGQSEYYRNLQ
jgi:hypothetical protein